MGTDLSTRLHAYATAAEVPVREGADLFADALSSSRSASAAASSSIICSHARELFMEAVDKAEGEKADGQTDGEPPETPGASEIILPLRPGENSLANLVLGAAGIPAIKGHRG